MSLNLRCSIQCVQALLPGMKAARFGRIVGISSRAALGKELRTVYAATKAGIEGMTRVWALELGGHGITANAVGPGPIGTEPDTTVPRGLYAWIAVDDEMAANDQVVITVQITIPGADITLTAPTITEVNNYVTNDLYTLSWSAAGTPP